MASCNEIGERIRQLREAKGLTQAQLAKELFIAKRETVSQWEAGTRDLKTEYTIKLADYFGVTCDYILRGVKAENVDINKRLGLSDESIAILTEMNDNIFNIETLNYLITEKELFYYIKQYLLSFVSDEIKKSDYKIVPLKQTLPAYYTKIMFSQLIEYLPKFRDKYKDLIMSDTPKLEQFMLEHLCRVANIDKCNYELYGYDFEECTPSKEDIVQAQEMFDDYEDNYNATLKCEEEAFEYAAKQRKVLGEFEAYRNKRSENNAKHSGKEE